jgi:hypothetical protein
VRAEHPFERVLDVRGWRGLTTTSHSTRQLQDLRRQLLDPPASIRRPPPAASESPDNVGTAA